MKTIRIILAAHKLAALAAILALSITSAAFANDTAPEAGSVAVQNDKPKRGRKASKRDVAEKAKSAVQAKPERTPEELARVKALRAEIKTLTAQKKEIREQRKAIQAEQKAVRERAKALREANKAKLAEQKALQEQIKTLRAEKKSL